MFEIPDAKRIRREDIHGSSDEDESHDEAADAALAERLHTQIASRLALDSENHLDANPSTELNPAREVGSAEHPEEDEQEELAFSFRLFRDEAPSHRIVLERQAEPGAYSRDAGFVDPKRHNSYYVAGEPSSEALAQLHQAAISADMILSNSKRRCWGLEKPWKVLTITMTPSSKNVDASQIESTATTTSKKKRPGKSRRIILRTRERVKKEKEEAAKKFAADKEQHVADKKKRLNREKKLKRREKARAAKQTSQGDGTAVPGTEDGSGDED